MTHIIDITNEHYIDISEGLKNFIIAKPLKKISVGDTIIFQPPASGETATTVTAIEAPSEENGLKTGWQAITFKLS